MADPFVIYTMGESGLFASALNGVAMLFNDTALYHGNGVGNLGFGAFFGMMLLFVVWLYNAAFKQQMDMRALLAPLIVYMVLTVPKTTVAIEDIYSGNVKSVANVPLGLALPASVASGISVVFTEIIEKAYQVVADYPNGYMPKISEDGYVTPLKLINALRDSASIVPSQSLLQTTKNIYQSCIVGNSSFNVEEYKKNADPMMYFTNAAKANSGNVVYVTLAVTGSTTEHIMTCSTAADELQRAMDAYIDGTNNSASGSTKINKIIGDVTLYNLKNSMIRQMSANGETAGFNPKPAVGGSTYDVNDLINYVSLMGNTSQDNARNFMMATIFNPMLETASYCYDQADGMSGMSKCSAWISSRSQWEEKNAAAGTGFLQVMRDGQNVLIMLSFLFFPIIVLFIMIQGTSSFKLLGNYMAFTVAAYLWLPMAAIINFYIQNTLSDEWLKVANATGVSTLNLITGPQFYAAVSQKLSLANALLASVPVLCMMLFSGMMMGMNQIYARMNSADAGNYDAKVNTPDVAKSAPMATSNSTVTISGMGVATVNGVSQVGISSSNTQKSATELSKSLSTQRSEIASEIAALESKLGVDVSKATTNSTSSGSQEAYAVAKTQNNGSVIQSGTSTSTQVSQTDGVDLGNAATRQKIISHGVAGSAGASGGANGSLTGGGNKDKNGAAPEGQKGKKAAAGGQLQAGAHVGGSVSGASSEVNSDGTTLTNQTATALSNVDANYNSTATTQANSLSTAHTSSDFTQRLKEIRNTTTETKGSGFTEQYSNDFNRIQQKIESLKQTEQQSVDFTSSVSAKASDVAGMIKMNPQAFEQLKSSVNNTNDPSFHNEVQRQNNALISIGSPEDRENVAIATAAFQSKNPVINDAAREFFNPQGNSRYNELSNQVGSVNVQDIGAGVDHRANNAQANIQQAQDQTHLNPSAAALPSSVNGPTSTQIQTPRNFNPSMVEVNPQSYSETARDANNAVVQGTQHLVRSEPKK